MQHQDLEPDPALRHIINGFWYFSFDFGDYPSGFEVLPDGYAEIIFHFGNPCGIVSDKGLQPLPAVFLMGLLGQPVVLQGTGRLQVIGVKCFPWAVFDLLGLPAGKDGVRTFEHPIAGLHSLLVPHIQAWDITAALSLVQQYFLDANARLPVDSMLFKAGIAMRAANGTLPVSEVAAAAHASRRTLERNFKQSSGHTVKDVSGLMRFEQVRDRLWCSPRTPLASLAQELGYADQAHLSREFKRYSGVSPAVFARKAKRGELSPGGDVVALVQGRGE